MNTMNIMLDYTVLLSLLTAVCCSGIVTKGNVKVDLGGSASLSCSLPDAAGVKQVTWQRLGHDDSVHTICTFSDNFKHVSPQYERKVELTQATLNSTTITINNVTFTDEGCYICTFNVYPSGTKRTKTCLTVQGLSTIATSKTVPDLDEQTVVVSCSATGKPAPVVIWTSTDKDVNHYPSNSSTSKNNDSTVTTTKSLTLPLSEFSGKHVECVAQSGNIERSVHIVIDKIVKESGETSRKYLSVLVVVICMIGAICIAIVLHRRRKECRKVCKSDLLA